MAETLVVLNRKTPQILAGLAGTLGCLGAGTIFAWTSPALPSIQRTNAFTLAEGDAALLGSLAILGMFLTCPLTGFLVERYGRQRTMMFFAIPFFIGWMQIAFAQSVLALKLGRFVTGFGGGSYFITIPMYISEISDKNMRGFLGICISIQISLGICITYIAGSFLDWSWLALVCSLVPLLILVTMVSMPESPRYLLSVGRISEASRNLCWLRGAGLTHYVDAELREIQANIELSNASSATWRDILKRETLKPTLIIIVIFTIQQSSGINVITFYSVSLIQETGTKIDAHLASILLATGQIISACFSSALIDRFGRRIIFFSSATLMATGMFLVTLFFMLKEHELADNIGWLPVLGLVMYMMAFASGVGPIPALLQGELLPPNTKGITSAINGMISWIVSIVVIEAYGPVKNIIGDAWSYCVFGIVLVFGIVFVYYALPETKGKTLEEIQEVFQSKDKSSSPSAAGTVEA